MPNIEKLFRCRIDYEANFEDREDIEDKAFLWSTKLDSMESFQGNAVCYPYFTAEHENEDVLKIWRDKVVEYINQLKSAKLST